MFVATGAKLNKQKKIIIFLVNIVIKETLMTIFKIDLNKIILPQNKKQ